MRSFRTFVGTALILLVTLLLTFKLKATLGWSPDLILPTLVVAGFVLDIYALILLVLLVLWILNWQSGLPVELWVLGIAPIVAWIGKRVLPSVPWFTLSAIIVIGEIVFYAVADAGIFWANITFIIGNTLFAVFFGTLLNNLLEYVYGKG